MNKQQIIAENLGAMNNRAQKYHSPLSPTLAGWYCYPLDGGHSILCLLAKDLSAAFETNQKVSDYLLPVPVKSVLRGFTIVNDFVVVDLPYSSDYGLKINDEDEEF